MTMPLARRFIEIHTDRFVFIKVQLIRVMHGSEGSGLIFKPQDASSTTTRCDRDFNAVKTRWFSTFSSMNFAVWRNCTNIYSSRYFDCPGFTANEICSAVASKKCHSFNAPPDSDYIICSLWREKYRECTTCLRWFYRPSLELMQNGCVQMELKSS